MFIVRTNQIGMGPSLARRVLFHSLELAQSFRTSDTLKNVVSPFDVVHIHRFQGLGSQVFAIPKTNVVATVHDHALVDTRATAIRKGQRVDRLSVVQRVRAALNNRNLKNVRSVIFPTSRILSTHERLGLSMNPNQVKVIPHGWKIADTGQSRTILSGREGSRVFLYMGKLIPEKGLALLLQAWGDGISGCELWIAGSGQLSQECENLTGSIGIRYFGWADAGLKADLLAASDVLVMPSLLAENFSLVVAEGMISGLPVISTEIAQPTILESGVNGLICNATPTSLRDSIYMLSLDSSMLTKLSKGAKRTASELDFDVHGERVLATYHFLENE
ncbi:glycosyltransferase family 4 protein [Arthrobacter psychrolactophilus]